MLPVVKMFEICESVGCRVWWVIEDDWGKSILVPSGDWGGEGGGMEEVWVGVTVGLQLATKYSLS